MVCYGGNPEHKSNPGDFQLTPPSSPRRGKSLCDTVSIFKRATALGLLRLSLSNGVVDMRWEDGWPKTLWALTSDGFPVEAQYERGGSYHGYPMPYDDPFQEFVIERWRVL